MIKKERKKIYGISNNDKQSCYTERFKAKLPNFEDNVQHTSIIDTTNGLGTAYSEFQLSQRPKWIKTQSQFVNLDQYNELNQSFNKSSRPLLTRRSSGNFASMHTQQFSLPSLTSNVDEHLSAFKLKHANSSSVPNLNLIAKKLQTMSLSKSLNQIQDSSHSEEALMHQLNMKLKKDLRSDSQIDTNEEERLQLTELQKLLDVKEAQKLDNKKNLDLQFSRNYIASVDLAKTMSTTSSLCEQERFDTSNISRERSKSASTLFKPTKSLATLMPQKGQVGQSFQDSTMDLNDDDNISVLSNDVLHKFNSLKYNVNLDKMSFAPSRIKSVQLLEGRAIELNDLCESTANLLAQSKQKSISRKASLTTNSSIIGTEPSISSQNQSVDSLDNIKSNRPKTVASLHSTLDPLHYVNASSSRILLANPTDTSKKTFGNENNSEYYDNGYDNSVSFKTGKKIVPQPTPYLSRLGVTFSRESPDYRSVSSLYNNNHGLSDSQVHLPSEIFNPQSSAAEASRTSTAVSKFSHGDADVEYLKRKMLIEARYKKSQEVIEAMRERNEQYLLKNQITDYNNVRRKNNAIIRAETKALVDNILTFSKLPDETKSVKQDKKSSTRMWSGNGNLLASIHTDDSNNFTTEYSTHFTASSHNVT